MSYHTPLLLLTKVIILLLYCLSDVHGITEYYVKQRKLDNTSCPGEPCHTLNYFASNTHNAWSDVVVRFLPGNHSLNWSLYISSNSNLHLITFHPVTSIQDLSVNIHCSSNANFHFYNISNLTIDGLSFYNCGSNNQGTLYLQHVINFWVDYIKIQSWRTYTNDAIHIKNGFGKSVISHSQFSCDVSVQYWNAIDNQLTITQSIFKGSTLDIRLTDLKNITLHIEISENVFISSRWNAIINYLHADQSTATAHIRNCLVIGSMGSGLHFELGQNHSKLQLTM